MPDYESSLSLLDIAAAANLIPKATSLAERPFMVFLFLPIVDSTLLAALAMPGAATCAFSATVKSLSLPKSVVVSVSKSSTGGENEFSINSCTSGVKSVISFRFFKKFLLFIDVVYKNKRRLASI
jgi:hypothetical protein